MKKTLLTKTLLLLFALIAGSSSSWAAEKSYSLTFKTTGTSNDGSTSWSTSSKVSDVLTAGGDYVSSISAASNVYPARDGRGAKFGSASKAGSITFALSDDGKVKATKVVIKGGAYINKGAAENSAVKVNNGTAVAFNQTVTSYTEEDITYNFPKATDITSLTLTQNTASYGRLYIVSVTVYYEEDAAEGETASWTVDPASATVMAGQSTNLQLTTNYDGTLTFTSNDTGVATVSYNASTKVITVTGVAAGTTTISATGAATATYKAVSKSINVTVNHAELESNMTDVLGPLNYSYFGLTPSGSNTFVQPDVTSTDKTDNYGITLSFAKANGGTLPRFDPNHARLYQNNKLTITAPIGYYIRKIVFVEPSSNKGWAGTMTVDNGDYLDDNKTWYAEEDNVSSVEFTSDATKRIGSIEVYLMVSSTLPTISAAGYATFSFPLAIDFSGCTWMKVYTAAVSGSSVILTEVTSKKVPANTGVILTGDAGRGEVINDISALGGNELKVSDGTITGGDGIYALASKGDPAVVGFYKVKNTVTIPAGKCYLNTAAGAPDFLGFDDNATGIDEVRGKTEEVRGEFYNLAGQRVAQPTKGLYIVNGKKVVMK